jgi:hypothetical protein
MNIPEIRQKIKNGLEDLLAEWGLIAIVILVGLASFGLGRLSAFEEAKPAISVRQAAAASAPVSSQTGGLVVASKKGSAYHFPWCSGAQSIAEGNKVWFESEEAARAAGYSPAKNCKGLQ